MAKRELQLTWSEQMKIALKQERKRLDMLDNLKTSGGPFTDAEDVLKYMSEDMVESDPKVKKRRLKLEIQFARVSTTLLPKLILYSGFRKLFQMGKGEIKLLKNMQKL